jgi:hypothetical protein
MDTPLIVDNGYFQLEGERKSQACARELGLRVSKTFLWTKRVETTSPNEGCFNSPLE